MRIRVTKKILSNMRTGWLEEMVLKNCIYITKCSIRSKRIPYAQRGISSGTAPNIELFKGMS
jgi:hypothetical protein